MATSIPKQVDLKKVIAGSIIILLAIILPQPKAIAVDNNDAGTAKVNGIFIAPKPNKIHQNAKKPWIANQTPEKTSGYVLAKLTILSLTAAINLYINAAIL